MFVFTHTARRISSCHRTPVCGARIRPGGPASGFKSPAPSAGARQTAPVPVPVAGARQILLRELVAA